MPCSPVAKRISTIIAFAVAPSHSRSLRNGENKWKRKENLTAHTNLKLKISFPHYDWRKIGKRLTEAKREWERKKKTRRGTFAHFLFISNFPFHRHWKFPRLTDDGDGPSDVLKVSLVFRSAPREKSGQMMSESCFRAVCYGKNLNTFPPSTKAAQVHSFFNTMPVAKFFVWFGILSC